MKITDLSIELENIETTTLSDEEANEVFGGSKINNAFSSLVKKNSHNSKGVPGEGGLYDPSCIIEIAGALHYGI